MEKFVLLAQPWWVNLLIFIPLITYWTFRRTRLDLSRNRLLILAMFAMAFGFAEASVVVYLRAATGLLPGYQKTLADVRSSITSYDMSRPIGDFPQSLLAVESLREAATMFMLVSVSLLGASALRERVACFLWTFALWDIAYY